MKTYVRFRVHLERNLLNVYRSGKSCEQALQRRIKHALYVQYFMSNKTHALYVQ
jgi:hypothetical protein